MDWLSSEEAAQALGVKQATLYAYVSRGVLRRQRVPGRRESRFSSDEVARVAAGRRRGSAEREILVASSITALDPAGALAYRGVDIAEVATWPYEQAAEWLWSGDDLRAAEAVATSWVAAPRAVRVGRRAQEALPDAATFADRLRVVTAAVATTDPLRHDRRAPAVVSTGRSLVAALVDSLPLLGAAPAPDAPVATRLWPRLSARPAKAAWVAALDVALVLVADHELAASTFAARVAASTWADPYLVVLAGMAALGGPLHGQASDDARALLRDALARSPQVAVGDALRRATGLPGFGHSVYVGADPRCPLLLDAVARAKPPAALWRVAHEVLRVNAERGGAPPNIDFALAMLGEAAGMPDGAGEAVFAVARTAGWIAHAIEEYEHRGRYRIRASYTGPPPGP